VPIHAELRVEKFAVAFDHADAQRVRATNKQAEVEGHVEFYDAQLTSTDVAGSGPHDLAALTRTLPANLAQWRVSVRSRSGEHRTTDAFLLNCTGSDGCIVTDQAPIKAKGATLVLENPKEGNWQIVIRSREVVRQSGSYRVREAQLVPNASPAEASDAKHASGATWSVPLPTKHGDAVYTAFRIAGKPFRILDDDGNEPSEYQTMQGGPTDVFRAKQSGLRIAVTPLTPGAP